MIDLLTLEETTISRDLKGKYICIYGQPKVGKTTFAAAAPNNLLLAFEKGYNAIAGLRAADIEKWSDLKLLLRQLRKDEVKEKYDTVTFDTIKIAWDLCEKHICAIHGVTKIGDIPWGAGYKECSQEFQKTLRHITMMGYGVIIIAHATIKDVEVDTDTVIKTVEPNIPKRAYEIVNQMVDIIGYIGVRYSEDGKSERTLFTRQTQQIVAGSRFKYLPPEIPFGYRELSEALAQAIQDEEDKDGATLVDHDAKKVEVLKVRPFNEIYAEALKIWQEKIIKTSEEGREEEALQNKTLIIDLIEKIFGERKKISEITEQQADLFELLILDMKEELK